MKRFRFAFVLFVFFGFAACIVTDAPNPIAEESLPVIYVSVVSHNEEPQPKGYVDFVKNENVFWQHHAAILEFAEALHRLGVTWNFQSEWNFLLAVSKYDEGTPATRGKNLLRYLVEDFGMEVDPHAHESKYNYADVAYLLDALGLPASSIAGGFIADPPEQSKFEYFLEPIVGNKFPYTWTAEALWGGGTGNHVNENALHVSGIWYPTDNEAFFENNPRGTLPEIGGYKSKEGFDALQELLDFQRAGILEPGQIYTMSIFFTQSELLKASFQEDFLNQVQAFQSYVDSGRMQWLGLQEVLSVWESDYEARGGLFWGDQF